MNQTIKQSVSTKISSLYAWIVEVWNRINSSKRSKLIFNGVAFLITALVLFWLVWREKDVLLTYTWDIHWEALAISFVIFSISLQITVLIWADMLNTIGKRVSYMTHLKNYCISHLTKRLPGTVWFVGWRIKLYSTDGMTPRQTTIASAIEFVVFIISTFLTAIIFSLETVIKYQFGLVVIIILVVMALIALHPAVTKRITKDVDMKQLFKTGKIPLWIALTIVVRILSGGVFFYVINTFYPLASSYLTYIIGIHSFVGLLSTAVFLSPNNFGISEITFSMLLVKLIPTSISVVILVFNRIIMIAYETLWALLLLGYDRIRVHND